ncbi:MAG TPA: energy transducer TonB [Candidatus Dormibacteraeota bacterium]|nr:energy transducer TonB [Candidatus Dormibacteraeota bacterium]
MLFRNSVEPYSQCVSGVKRCPSLGFFGLRALVALLLLFGAPSASPVPQQNERKLLHRVEPVYPPLARSLRLTGVVKLHLLIAPDGRVKSAEPIGGHPILIEAFLNAVEKWKYEVGPKETKANVEFKFKPDL